MQPFPVMAAANQENDVSPWDKSVTLSGGMGYDDNILLSTDNRQESPFWASRLEFMLFRIPVDRHQFYFFLSGEDYRFLKSDVGTDKEQTLITATEYQYSLTDAWDAGLGLQYLFQDRVFDVSVTEATVTTVPLTGHSLEIAPTTDYALTDNDEITLDWPIRRQYFREPLDDYWESGPELELEHSYGNRSEITLSYEFRWRFYDNRTQRDPNGLSRPGTSLEFLRHEIALGNQHYWDENRHWRTETEVGLKLNDDNGSGYYDYMSYFIEQELRYKIEAWEIEAAIGLDYYDYARQRAGPFDRDKRERLTWDLSLEGKRRIYKNLDWFAEWRYDKVVSNRDTEEYYANSVITGLDWSF